MPAKQRHTAKRIFERLRDEHGYHAAATPSSRTTCTSSDCDARDVRAAGRIRRATPRSDFGEALAVIGGVSRKIHFFAMDLPHSDACFVKAYPAETTRGLLRRPRAAFAFFGGVPHSILYDNTKIAVARILATAGGRARGVFSELQSHYLFADRFGRPGKGNDKGKVEGLVGYARRNFIVPVPQLASFEALNADLERLRDAAGRRGCAATNETIGERLRARPGGLAAAAAAPYEACEKRAARVSSLSLVRYRGNDYSVPTAYGHREVLVRGYVDEVVDRLRRRGDRPPSALLRARGLHLRSAALPGAAGAEDRRARSGRATRRLELARGVRHLAAACSRRAWASRASASTSRCCG